MWIEGAGPRSFPEGLRHPFEVTQAPGPTPSILRDRLRYPAWEMTLTEPESLPNSASGAGGHQAFDGWT